MVNELDIASGSDLEIGGTEGSSVEVGIGYMAVVGGSDVLDTRISSLVIAFSCVCLCVCVFNRHSGLHRCMYCVGVDSSRPVLCFACVCEVTPFLSLPLA